jgi:hypothetical protein
MQKFVEKISDPQYKEMILDSLCNGVNETSKFRDLLEYVINNKLHHFDNDVFNSPLYDDEEEPILLVLPCIRRIYAKVFINIPDIFKAPDNLDKIPYGEFLYKKINDRLELFQLYFDIDEFIDYLLEVFPKVIGCLSEFYFLDKTSETLSLIVDNYIAKLIKKVKDLSHDLKDILIEIRNAKIKKLSK